MAAQRRLQGKGKGKASRSKLKKGGESANNQEDWHSAAIVRCSNCLKREGSC